MANTLKWASAVFIISGLAWPNTQKPPAEEEIVISGDTMILPPMTIMGGIGLLPEISSGTREETCKKLDQKTVKEIYTLVEQMNNAVGADYSIVADPVMENEYSPTLLHNPRVFDPGLAAGFNGQADNIKFIIQQMRETEPYCPMTGAGNAHLAFARITWDYERRAQEAHQSREEGIIIPRPSQRELTTWNLQDSLPAFSKG